MPKKQTKQAKPKKQDKAKTNEVIAVKKLLSTAPEQHSFFVADGTMISNLAQLVDRLETMHEDTYKFHANNDKNDFSNWIRDIFEDAQLAESLKTASNKIEAQLAIAKRLLKEVL